MPALKETGTEHLIKHVKNIVPKKTSQLENDSGYITGISKEDVTYALGYTPLNQSLKGSASGLAELDANGKVPSSQLPSYVDDVIEGYLSGGKFYKESAHTTEISGESGKIYIDLHTEKTYRWSGSTFGVISETLALGETSSTAYRGDRGKTAYDHSQSAHAPSNAQANVIETVKVNGTTLTPSSKAVNIAVPTNNNQLTNGAGYITSSGTAKTISDTLPISKGGTGKTTGVDAANTLINSLSTGDSTPTDNDYYISQYVGGGTTTTTYHRRPMSALWNYIKSKLATVATTGSYNDLSNKPTIPTVGNGTVTIKQAGTSKGTFTMNQSGNTTIELTDNNTTYGVATQSANGLESAADKKKLDGIATGAEVNQNAFSNVIVGSTTIASDSKTDTFTLVAGTNITLTPDTTNNKITISSSHESIATSTDTTSTVSPSAGGTFTAVDSVTRDSNGHVTKVNTKTVTLPNTAVTVDSALSSTSTNPVQNKVVYDALNGKSDAGHTHTKSEVGLGNVDNTADADKYVKYASTADKAIMAEQDGNGNVIADTYIPLSGGVMTGDIGIPSAPSAYNGSAVYGGLLTLPLVDGVTDFNELSNYKSAIGSVSTSYGWQNIINIRHRNGYEDGTLYGMYIRSNMTADGSLIYNKNMSGNWTGERTILDSDNYSSYALPLSGGTMTGAIKRNGDAVLNTGSDGSTNFSGGAALFDGATLILRGSTQSGMEGRFELHTTGGYRLFGYPSGELSWNGVYINLNSSDYYTHIYSGSSDYPHLVLKQYSNSYILYPNQTKMADIGESGSRFGNGYFNNVYNSSGAITTSDRNKKNSIKDLDGEFVIKIIEGLAPKSFKFNDGTSGRTHFGIIAQDLEELLESLGISNMDFAPLVKEYPDKEVEIENPDYDEDDESSQKYIKKLEKDYDGEPTYNVRYEEFIMLIVKYCQQLKSEIEEMKLNLGGN